MRCNKNMLDLDMFNEKGLNKYLFLFFYKCQQLGMI